MSSWFDVFVRRIVSVLFVISLMLSMYTIQGHAAELTKGKTVKRYQVDLPRTNVAQALNLLAEQTDTVLLFPYKEAESRQSNPVNGFYSLIEALDLLLFQSGFSGSLSDDGIVKILLIDDSKHQDREENKMHRKKGFLALLSAIFTAVGASQGAVANEVENSESREIEEIMVSASRIKSSGFESPTPVTVLGEELIKDRGITNIADLVNEVPSLVPAQTPATTLSSRGSGVNGLDIRGLGSNRNLVMVNGRRHVPTNEFGEVDINVIPSALIKRVDVVTGGASAAWGSDAISGVVNVIYDKDFEGAKAEVQYGQSSESDAEETRLSFAFGSGFDNDRGHLLMSIDTVDNKGVPRGNARGWNNKHPAFLPNSADTGPNDGIPANIITNNVSLYLGTPGGAVLAPFDPVLGDLEFLPGGTAQPRSIGAVGGNLMVGGSGSFLQDSSSIRVPIERTNFLTAVDYDLTDSLTVFFEGTYSESDSVGNLVDSFTFGQPILSGNPYLPADVQQTLDDNSLPGFLLWRTNGDFGTIATHSESENQRYVLGFEGQLDSGWSWDAYYQYGKVVFTNVQKNNVITANLAEAVNAVDAGGGNIVCASGNSDCVPINLFGVGSPSQAAINYVTGDGFSETTIEQDVFAVSLSGDLAEGWTGPISSSFGFEYREEKLDRKVDDVSLNSGFLITNAKPLNGEFDVKEVFAEFAIPLLSGKSFAESLDLNLAARYTEYSSSGAVTTWKGGVTYEPVESVKFRGAISRDIRAPSIGELYLESLFLFDTVANPFTNVSQSTPIQNRGNPDLLEEEATSKTFGIVYSPSWLDGFQVSADWYHTEVKGAVSQVTNQYIVDGCFAGDAEFCGLINFNPVTQEINQIENTFVNLGIFEVEGVDFEARYMTDLGAGELTLNLVSSYVAKRETSIPGGQPVDLVGTLSLNSGGSLYGVPEWKTRASAAYNQGNFGAFMQVRYIGEGEYNNSFGPEELSRSDNKIDAEWYMDFSTRYLIDGAETEWEVYGGINNVFDREPPAVPQNFFSPTPTNYILYDVVGRYMYIGVRAKF